MNYISTLFILFITSLTRSLASQPEVEIKPNAIITAPGLGEKEYIGPLSEILDKLSPKDDGWDTEVFNEAASKQLYKLVNILKNTHLKKSLFTSIAIENCATSALRPDDSQLIIATENEFQIGQWKNDPNPALIHSLPDALQQLRSAFAPEAKLQVATKLYKIQPKHNGATLTNVLIGLAGQTKTAQRRQVNAEWQCEWVYKEEKPVLTKIKLLHYQEVTRTTATEDSLFSDQTSTALGINKSFSQQLLHSTDHWRARFPRTLGIDVVANVGFLLADLNGDGLEDLYFCQQGGLPNLLYIRQADGTFIDHSTDSGVDILDFSPSALAIDLDKDGDRDLIIALQFELLLMRNDGKAKFELIDRVPLQAQTFSISAADYDLDGDLDIFTCGYNPTNEDLEESGALGSPTPFHDANNGGKNTLLQNIGSFKFLDVTESSGISKQNNSRFSFAASWEDYDRDGDPDLYVANDYGRNNLYENNHGKFIDVAGKLKVEDMSSGMSVSWGDLNRDGFSDLYVSNMFSSAGNRITFQSKFLNGNAGDTLDTFKRFARGNSLFHGTKDAKFKDVSIESEATMARWAWGSRLADLNNDGWEDILVANGFITTPDSGDL